jgi:hypothetical protein
MKFVWITKHQHAYGVIKVAVEKQIFLTYPAFKLSFDTYTDASKFHIGAFITQSIQPLLEKSLTRSHATQSLNLSYW